MYMHERIMALLKNANNNWMCNVSIRQVWGNLYVLMHFDACMMECTLQSKRYKLSMILPLLLELHSSCE